MTLAECMNVIDEIEPNAYAPEVKAHWLQDCMQSVQRSIFLLAPGDLTAWLPGILKIPLLFTKWNGPNANNCSFSLIHRAIP